MRSAVDSMKSQCSKPPSTCDAFSRTSSQSSSSSRNTISWTCHNPHLLLRLQTILTCLLKAYMCIESCSTWRCLGNYHIYSNARHVFSLNLALNMWGCLEFMYDAPCQTMSSWTTDALPNCRVRSLLFSDIIHSLSGNLGEPIGTTFKDQDIQKREQGRTEITWKKKKSSFCGTCLSSNFFKKHDILEAGSVSVVRQRSTLDWRYFPWMLTSSTVTC